jgi:hypothetical protein
MSSVNLKGIDPATLATPAPGRYRTFISLSGALCRMDSSRIIIAYAEGITEEQVEDIVGGLLSDSATINVTYDDTNNLISFDVIQTALDHINLQNKGVNTHAQIDTHISRTDNPHSTTKAAVGLGNCDNTSDANKPVSSAQQVAIDGAKNRSVHTGTQLASTISDFATTANGLIDTKVAAHVALADPHTQYAMPMEITSAIDVHELTVDHPLVTTTTQGMMSPTDKVKLDGVTSPVVKKNITYPSSNSNSVLTNITELAFNVVAGHQYSVKIRLPYSAQATGTGIAFALANSGGASAQLTGTVGTHTATGTFTSQLLDAFNTVRTFTNSANTTNNYLEASLIMLCYSNGTITPQFRSEVNGSQIQILGAGILEVIEI